MRAGEITSLTWGQVDLMRRVVTVGRAKTSSGTGRQIPMNSDLFAVLSVHAAWPRGMVHRKIRAGAAGAISVPVW
jgi:integrase